jgi:hypothetical protein
VRFCECSSGRSIKHDWHHAAAGSTGITMVSLEFLSQRLVVDVTGACDVTDDLTCHVGANDATFPKTRASFRKYPISEELCYY